MGATWKLNPRIKNIIRKALVEGNEDSIEVFEDKVIRNAPVDSGKLKKNIEVESSDGGLTQTLRVKVPYAQVVEFGTHKRAADPFVRTALKSSRAEMLRKFRGKL